jgi:predicted GNAT family acetyltransferase
MKANSEVDIIDITGKKAYGKYLYKCLAPMPFRKYKYRQEYLEKAVPKGLHKKLLTVNGAAVGTIEYGPAESCGYPITGEHVIVMNCVWVLKKAKKHGFGRLLVEHMVNSERKAAGFATIALENHWSPWFKKNQIEKLGFRSVDVIDVVHKTKHKDHVFRVHLMWMPTTERTKAPNWNKQKLLQGETFCMAHPLYHPQKRKERILEAKKRV